MLNNRFREILSKTTVLGMIHLAGRKPVKRALEEMAIFEEEGIDGAIVENYHGTIEDVIKTLREISRSKTSIKIGVNVLPNEYQLSLVVADAYAADFVQLDHVAGAYTKGSLDFEDYARYKLRYPTIVVLGGVWPKFYTPIPGSDLKTDLKLGAQRAEAVVVTGAATGLETPIEKIREFREIIGPHPLVVGAGLTPENAYEQLMLADAAIVGSCLKPYKDTERRVDRTRVRDLMQSVRQVRAEKMDL